ncbi:MAG: carbohydrate ABC transporter permease [Cellulosilyticaceae bacterium]
MKSKRTKSMYPMWLTMPAAAVYTLFFIVPIIAAFILAFTDWNISRMFEPEFTGMKNFFVLMQDEVFIRSIFNTLLFAFSTTILKVVIGLGLALILARKFWGNNVFRTLFYMPCTLSTVVVGLLFTSILSKEGLLNNILAIFGFESAIDWLGSYPTAMLWIILMEVWMWAGFCMFIFIAGLQAIPKDYYECANIEGASKWKTFTQVTLPLLVPSFTVVITLNITGGLKVFDMVYILTNGGPGFDTQVLNTYTYRSFGIGLLGEASASAIILSIIVVVITFIMNKILKDREVEM